MRRMSLVGLLLVTPLAAPAQESGPPRTPWGDPDLNGYWRYRSTTPLQRPAALAGKAVLTPAEEAEYLTERHAAIGRERDLQLNADWWQPGGLTDGRTSLIVDPPDGRLPQRTPAGAERARTLGIAIRLRSADGPEDRERYERCIMGRTVPLLAVSPNRLAQIFQTPDYVAILHEQNSDLRIVPLDGRPAPPASIRQWQGSSRARWKGDTLVVETGGFNGRVDHPGQRTRRALRRAHPVRRRRHPALRVHGARPRLVRRPLDGDVPDHARHRPGVRERLPRGELQHAAHPARRARPGGREAVTGPPGGAGGDRR